MCYTVFCDEHNFVLIKPLTGPWTVQLSALSCLKMPVDLYNVGKVLKTQATLLLFESS